MIVSNATPLLAFARIDALELLAHIVRHILIPETVWHEVTRDPWRPDPRQSVTPPGLRCTVAAIPPEILPLLDRGEAEVIALAEAIGATEVVLDERAARAGGYGAGAEDYWDCGTARACQASGLIPAVRPWLERMQSQGIRYSQRFVEELFRQLGE